VACPGAALRAERPSLQRRLCLSSSHFGRAARKINGRCAADLGIEERGGDARIRRDGGCFVDDFHVDRDRCYTMTASASWPAQPSCPHLVKIEDVFQRQHLSTTRTAALEEIKGVERTFYPQNIDKTDNPRRAIKIIILREGHAEDLLLVFPSEVSPCHTNEWIKTRTATVQRPLLSCAHFSLLSSYSVHDRDIPRRLGLS
jgi:hypothetical protein